MNAIPNTFLPPWPEWNDNEINSEKWNPDGGSPKKPATKQKNELQQEIPSFEDPCGHGVLPPEFEVTEWKRPRDINPDVNFSVISNTSSQSDVFSRNIRLLGSNIMQSLLMSILWLEKKAESSPFPVEFQGPKFQFPLTAWKPWHHVYANCKISKGMVHKPEYNSYGKYVVRLFFIGMWRRITVDDYLPIDVEGNVLLPLAKDPRDLWLPILCKALLRIAMIPDTSSGLCNLTGWLRLSICCSFIDQESLWNVFVKLKKVKNDNFENRPKMCITTDSIQCVNDSLLLSCASLPSALIIMDFENPVVKDGKYLAASSMVFEVFDDENYIKAKEEIQKKRWKAYRWRKWAVEHGLIKDTEKCPGRKVLLFGPMFCAPIDAPTHPITQSTSDLVPDEDYFSCHVLHELTENLRMLHIYFKTSDFDHNFNILDINEILSKATEKKAGSKKDDKGSAKSKSVRGHNESTSSYSSGCFYIGIANNYDSVDSLKFKFPRAVSPSNRRWSFPWRW